MDLRKLKAKLTECNVSYQQAADYLGISVTAFSNKINGKSIFNVVEINSLAKLLRLTDDEILDLFNINRFQ